MKLLSQDIVICLILLEWENKPYSFLSEVSGLSVSQCLQSVRRLQDSKLVSESRVPVRKNLLEFLQHGVRYCFPARVDHNVVGKGMLTGHSSELMKQLLHSEHYVWRTEGKDEGVIVKPIHDSALIAAQKSDRIYKILTLLDSLRLGKSRERELASSALKELIYG